MTFSSKPASAQSCCGGTAASPAIDAKARPDLMTNCPVSGEILGKMGQPFVFAYQGQEVKLCCPGCKKDFDKDPAKYLKKIEAAAQPAATGNK
jgi:YHS domain-containing protein